MKKTVLKRLISLSLISAMLLSFSSCSNDSGKSENKAADGTTAVVTEETITEEPSDTAQIEYADKFEYEDLSYVMVYNPNIFSEESSNNDNILKTGNFGTQIDVDGDRGEDLEEEPQFTKSNLAEQYVAIDELTIDSEGDRGDVLGVDYKEGDTREFYIDKSANGFRSSEEMECIYSGKYCNIWSNGTGDLEFIKELGTEFDENIFEQETDCFGSPRFVDGVGRVNLLFYKMSGSVCGFFSPLDMFSSYEVSDSEAAYYGANRDHAIVHINSALTYDSMYQSLCKATISHEFQHLICGKYLVENETQVANWLNEAMSGYIEETFYPGVKDIGGDFDGFNRCRYIRRGQSLYNFYKGYSNMGVYGSVYYYTEYLADLAGEDIFSKIHGNMPRSNSEYNDYEVLAMSLPENIKSEVDGYFAYPEDIVFDNEDQELMSKLTLDFYLNVFANEDIKNYDNIDRQALLYDSLQGTEIEGGGRVVVAVKDGEFTFPEDADEGLIYVALNEDFEPIGYAYH